MVRAILSFVIIAIVLMNNQAMANGKASPLIQGSAKHAKDQNALDNINRAIDGNYHVTPSMIKQQQKLIDKVNNGNNSGPLTTTNNSSPSQQSLLIEIVRPNGETLCELRGWDITRKYRVQLLSEKQGEKLYVCIGERVIDVITPRPSMIKKR